GRNGFLCPHDSSALTHYLLELGKNTPLREALGREARKTVVEKFSLDKMAEEHIDLYRQLLSQG
ncbi:MAG: glycosyltransferase, partial [bacterium]